MEKEMKIKTVTFETELIQTIMNYLGTRPYQEVASIINAIQVEVQKEFEVQKEMKKDE